MGRIFIDDNYGAYEVGPDDDLEEMERFYLETQRASVRKKCKGCRRTVKIKPEYAYCDSCADKRERGYDI